jgi:hypothetical protein
LTGPYLLHAQSFRDDLRIKARDVVVQDTAKAETDVLWRQLEVSDPKLYR